MIPTVVFPLLVSRHHQLYEGGERSRRRDRFGRGPRGPTPVALRTISVRTAPWASEEASNPTSEAAVVADTTAFRRPGSHWCPELHPEGRRRATRPYALLSCRRAASIEPTPTQFEASGRRQRIIAERRQAANRAKRTKLRTQDLYRCCRRRELRSIRRGRRR